MNDQTLTQTTGNDDAGFVEANRLSGPIPEERLDGFIGMLTNKNGNSRHKYEYELREAMTRRDFPILLGNVLDRQLLARYQVETPDWKSYIKTMTVRDFRVTDIIKAWGAEDQLTQVAENGEYPGSKMSEAKYTIQVYKYGRQFPITWESLVNDSLNAFGSLADRLNRAALRTEWKEATKLIAASTGPHTGLYGATITDIDSGAITNKGSLPLTAANLQTTLKLMAQQKDAHSEPIFIKGIHLVVPPALEFTARQILQSSTLIGTPASNLLVGSANVVATLGIQLHVNAYLPLIDTTKGDATWYIFADPTDGPAAAMAYLQGYESPQVVMKVSDKASTGGGLIGPFEGSFETDSVTFRVRHIIGGTRLDPRYTYAQTGS